MRVLSRNVRSPFAELGPPLRPASTFLLGALLGLTAPHAEAAPTPKPAAVLAPVLVKVPRVPQRSEYVVEVNKKGQVIRVRSAHASRDPAFNTVTYGNALQAFIRTPDGRAIPGVYRLTYEYDPAQRKVRRSVALLHPGGVNANAPGAVDQLIRLSHPQAAGAAEPRATPARR